MNFTTGLMIWCAIGLVFSLYGEYELAQAQKDPLFGMMMQQPTFVQRAMNFFLVIVAWPVVVIKLVLR